jgi:hypothetical protein
MRDKFIIELARNGYIVTEQDGDKVIFNSLKALYEEEFCLIADSLKACGKIEVELNIAEIDEEETDELVEE